MNYRSHVVTLCEEVQTLEQWGAMWARARTLNRARRALALSCDNTAHCDVPQGRQMAEESVNL